MKTLHYAILAAAALLLASCSDFLDRKPLTEPNSTTFLKSASAVNNYINGLYTALPCLKTYGMGSREEDRNSDNIVAETYDRRLHGELQETVGGVEDWTRGYNNLRAVNYFFKYYDVPEIEENEEVRSMKGEAYFLRAYWHYYLLTRFGHIPLMKELWDENATVAGLQIPMSDRYEVAAFLLEDLRQAEDLLLPRSRYHGLRISKEAAMIFAMRAALYEGTWEKYHRNDGFAAATDQSETLFRKVIEIGDRLAAMHTLQLHVREGDGKAESGEEAFGRLFNADDLSDVTEAVFWKKYSIDGGVTHNLSAFLAGGYTGTGGPAGLSKSLIDNYLKSDGTFIDPTDLIYRDFNLSFENRDGRMLATVMHTGCKFKSTSEAAKSRPMNVIEWTEEDKDKARPPFLNDSGNQKSTTGYHIRLGIDTSYVDGQSETALPIIRYAEALVTYAEAAEELGICTDEVLEKTIRPLRERAGVTYVKPSEIDPHFSDFGYPLTPNLQEIRRERRSEFALQGFRLDDLMRWRGAKLFTGIAHRGKGAYINEDGILFKAYGTSVRPLIKSLPKDGDGWLDPLRDILPNGYRFNEERDYLLPIPPSDLRLNRKLRQNPGWGR